MPPRANLAEFAASADPDDAEETNHPDYVLVGEELDVPAGDKSEDPRSRRGQAQHEPAGFSRGVIDGGCSAPEGEAQDRQNKARSAKDCEDATASDLNRGLYARSQYVHRVETTLQGELALGGRVSAFLSEAVSVDAKPPGDLQRKPLQRHHVDDWSQSFIDRRRFQGNRRFETHGRGTDGKGRHADLVEG